MIDFAPRQVIRLHLFGLALASVCSAGLMTGCAGASGVAAAEADSRYVTQSDEPELRRRARIRLELAISYLGLGQTKVALDEVKQSLVIDPTYPEAYNVRGLVYMRLNDFPAADDSFQRSLVLRPGDADVMQNRASLLCQMQKYAEADAFFVRVLATPGYGARSKTLTAQGLCQERAGHFDEAEKTLLSAYDLEAGNPVIAYNVASLKYRRGEYQKAQFYIRRLNNSELANSESLWLAIKIERALKDTVSMRQLGDQLRRRFPDSHEYSSLERGAFDE